MKTVFCGAIINLLAFTSFAQNPQGPKQTGFQIKMEEALDFNGEPVNNMINQGRIDPGFFRGSLAISPDLQYYMGKIGDSTILLLNLHNRKVSKLPISHKLDYAHYSGDGGRVLLRGFGGKSATILEVKSGKILSTLNSPEKIDWANISFNGERIFTTRAEVKIFSKEKNFTNLWNADDGKLVATIKGCADFLFVPQFSSDGRFLLADCEKLKNNPIKLFDANTGEEIRSFEQDHRYASPKSALSPDGKTIASIYRFVGIRLWDVDSGNLRREFIASQGDVLWITFANDGRSFATNGRSPIIRLWDTETGQLLQTFATEITKSPAYMLRVRFSSDGKTLAGVDKRGRVTVWEVASGEVKFTFNEQARKENMSVLVFFGLDDNVLYVRNEKSITAIDVGDGRVFGEIPNPTGIYFISAEGDKIFTLNKKEIEVWSVK